MGQIFDKLRMSGKMFTVMKGDLSKLTQFATASIALNPHWGQGGQRAMQLEMEFAERWSTRGEIVYNLSHSLAAMFALTSSPEIDWDHLPHEAFVIQVPRVYLPLPGTIEPDSSYIYISKHQALLVSDYDTTALVMNYGQGSATAFETMDMDAMIKNVKAFKFSDHASVDEISAGLKEDVKFAHLPDDKLKMLAQAMLMVEQDQLQHVAADMARMPVDRKGMYTLGNRFVANVLAYVAETKSGSVARRADVERAGTVVNLLPPHDVVINRAFRDTAKDVVNAVLSGSVIGIRRAMAHRVRGHWRDQPVGPGRTQRKRIWIWPHERGSEDIGTVVRRVETMSVPGVPKIN